MKYLLVETRILLVNCRVASSCSPICFLTLVLGIFFSFPSFPPPAHTCFLAQCYTTCYPQKQAPHLTTPDCTRPVLYMILKRLKKKSLLLETTYCQNVAKNVLEVPTVTPSLFALQHFRGVAALVTTMGLAFCIDKSSSKLQILWLFPPFIILFVSLISPQW